jgi:hypothetical protein
MSERKIRPSSISLEPQLDDAEAMGKPAHERAARIFIDLAGHLRSLRSCFGDLGARYLSAEHSLGNETKGRRKGVKEMITETTMQCTILTGVTVHGGRGLSLRFLGIRDPSPHLIQLRATKATNTRRQILWVFNFHDEEKKRNRAVESAKKSSPAPRHRRNESPMRPRDYTRGTDGQKL